ncbi:MAG TPA: Rrf2 family transcriptional regulator [Candidatus Cloacimonadota bacterium]|jgi:Rrf2 family protein|nr:Rrf2 family transcriptional regulator [Candidatus Cloacimonadota bacterium]
MAVNTKTEYALRVILEISEAKQMSAQKICDAQKLSKKYIEHLLSLLKSAGIVKSSIGSKGGYTLAKELEDISFMDLLDAMEDKSFSSACDIDTQRSCMGEGCNLTQFFGAINSKLEDVFRTFSLADAKRYWKGGMGS